MLLGLPIQEVTTTQGAPVATDTETGVAMAGEAAAGRASSLFSCIDDDRDELNVDDQLVNLFVCTMSIVKRNKRNSNKAQLIYSTFVSVHRLFIN